MRNTARGNKDRRRSGTGNKPAVSPTNNLYWDIEENKLLMQQPTSGRDMSNYAKQKYIQN